MFALTKPEVRQVLAAIDLTTPFGRRDYLLVLFLYHTGLRVGECSGLITHHVALAGEPRQYLHLPATVCKGSRGRVVPLNAVAQKCIRKLLAFNCARGFFAAPPGRAASKPRPRSTVGEHRLAWLTAENRTDCAGRFPRRKALPSGHLVANKDRGHVQKILGDEMGALVNGNLHLVSIRTALECSL
jgi:integrase